MLDNRYTLKQCAVKAGYRRTKAGGESIREHFLRRDAAWAARLDYRIIAGKGTVDAAVFDELVRQFLSERPSPAKNLEWRAEPCTCHLRKLQPHHRCTRKRGHRRPHS